MSHKRICIIPARAGSKRIPGKNIRVFHGQPIIGYPIAAALESGLFQDVMVSTDSEEIAAIAKSCGASVPFMRSASASTDAAATADVWREVISEYEVRGHRFDTVISIYPTAAFVTVEHLKEAVHLLDSQPDLDGVIPLLEFESPIQRGMRLNEGIVESLWPEHNTTRTQDLEPCYFDAGQFYLFRVTALKRFRSLREARRGAVVLSPFDAQDIDTEEGWRLAELKYQMKRESTKS